mgnify:CR=1 FL=1
MKFDLFYSLDHIKDFLSHSVEVLLLVVSVSLLLGIIFGPETPFVGIVYGNLASILESLGEKGIVALVSILIILLVWKK